MMRRFHNNIRRLRFTPSDDLILLRETLGHNPFLNNKNWVTITENVKKATRKDFSMRCIREHVELLINLYIKNDTNNIKKYESEEQYSEKKQILEELINLKQQYGSRKRQKSNKYLGHYEFIEIPVEEHSKIANESVAENSESSQTNQNIELCQFVYEDLLSANEKKVNAQEKENETISNEATEKEFIRNISPSITGDSDSISQTIVRQFSHIAALNNSITDYLNKKLIHDTQIKEKEFELEEKKMEIERKKLELQEKKLELERKDQESRLKMMEQQQQIINILLKKLSNS